MQLKQLLKDKTRIAGIIFCVLMLALLRAKELHWFYDPFRDYFKGEYRLLSFPDFNSWKLFVSIFSRYGLNMVFSLGIIYFIFKDKPLVKFAFWLYALLFVFLVFLFYGVIFLLDHKQASFLFYIRRFLIHPVFVILFVPAFFFQKEVSGH